MSLGVLRVVFARLGARQVFFSENEMVSSSSVHKAAQRVLHIADITLNRLREIVIAASKGYGRGKRRRKPLAAERSQQREWRCSGSRECRRRTLSEILLDRPNPSDQF